MKRHAAGGVSIHCQAGRGVGVDWSHGALDPDRHRGGPRRLPGGGVARLPRRPELGRPDLPRVPRLCLRRDRAPERRPGARAAARPRPPGTGSHRGGRRRPGRNWNGAEPGAAGPPARRGDPLLGRPPGRRALRGGRAGPPLRSRDRPAADPADPRRGPPGHRRRRDRRARPPGAPRGAHPLPLLLVLRDELLRRGAGLRDGAAARPLELPRLRGDVEGEPAPPRRDLPAAARSAARPPARPAARGASTPSCWPRARSTSPPSAGRRSSSSGWTRSAT